MGRLDWAVLPAPVAASAPGCAPWAACLADVSGCPCCRAAAPRPLGFCARPFKQKPKAGRSWVDWTGSAPWVLCPGVSSMAGVPRFSRRWAAQWQARGGRRESARALGHSNVPMYGAARMARNKSPPSRGQVCSGGGLARGMKCARARRVRIQCVAQAYWRVAGNAKRGSDASQN